MESSSSPPQPGWPQPASSLPGGARVLFLLDVASTFDEKILLEWIEQHRPTTLSAGDVETLRIPSSRRPRRSFRSSSLEPALATSADQLVAPLRVVWLAPEKEGRREASYSDLLGFGDPRDPGALRARWIARRSTDRCRVVVGEPATVSQLRARWQAALGADVAETVGFERFVARQAALALDRAERGLRGGRYKIPRFLKEEVLSRPAFQGGLEQLAREQGQPAARVRRDAERYLREIAADQSPLWIDVFARLCRSSSTRGYEQLRVDPAQIEEIRRLTAEHPVVFLPTHKSNLDHPVVFRAMHEAGLPPSHTAGGDNMNFFPAGPVARRAGIFFIRRTFKDNETYKFVLRSYIDFLVEKRFPLQWFIEGGRSRSGKMLPPRYGLLAYVVDSYLRGKSEDVILIPVSVAYDQISEVGDYAAEQRGAPKEREGIGWLYRFLKGLGRRYGKIDLRFGEPVSLKTALGPGATERADDTLVVPKLAFEVCARINRVTPVTPISLAMLALLGAGDRAMGLSEIHRALTDLARYVLTRGLPTSEKIRFDSEADVAQTLDLLVESAVLERFDEGPEVIYSIAPGQHLAAAYYRNTVIHFLTAGAIGELALLRAADAPVGEGTATFWAEAIRLRDLLKFEFFFSDKELFREEVRAELSLHGRDWETRIDDPDEARALLESIRPFQAHRTLRAFFEAYALVADRLVVAGSEPAGKESELVRDCLVAGKQYLRQRRIRSAESISKTLLQNGVRLAENLDLVAGARMSEADPLAERRLRFAHELHDTIRRIDAIDALDPSHRRDRRARLGPSSRRAQISDGLGALVMNEPFYERLSAMDTSFLVLEKPQSPLHVSATLVYEAGPMAKPDGGIDVDAYRAATESVLHRIPRYRQKLAWIPVVGHPVWVDDPEFNLEYHVRHTSLPRPGTDEQLKQLSARIMAQPLDHSKPLWEAWVVEGLDGGRFAVISKIHHCMVDGMAGQDLAQILHSTDPAEREREKAPVWLPRTAPTPSQLLRDELRRYVGLPGRAARGLREATHEIGELRSELTTRVRSMTDMMSSMRDEPSKTPLNGAIGPHRRFDWRDMPLEDVKRVRRALRCTINDLVLATVTGAVREFLIHRGHELAGIDFRIAAPVSIRSSEDPAMGNRVSQWFVRAPVDEADPIARVDRIRAATEELKASRQALDADLIMNIAEWTPTILLTLASRSASGSAPYNMMVTNVPGPQQDLYLLGARLEALYSQVPIADSTALGVALVSYAGKLCWGFNADFESVPDLAFFADAIETSFAEIAAAAGVALGDPAVSDRPVPSASRARRGSAPASRRPTS